MLQILVVLTMLAAGLLVLLKGKLQVSRSRVLPTPAGRVLGVTFMALSALPIVLPVETGLYVMLGAFFVACAVAFKVSEASPTRVEAPDSSRTGPSKGDQLVGAACVKCAGKIMTQTEGRACRTCGAPVHRDCHRAHRGSAHAKSKAGSMRESGAAPST